MNDLHDWMRENYKLVAGMDLEPARKFASDTLGRPVALAELGQAFGTVDIERRGIVPGRVDETREPLIPTEHEARFVYRRNGTRR